MKVITRSDDEIDDNHLGTHWLPSQWVQQWWPSLLSSLLYSLKLKFFQRQIFYNYNHDGNHDYVMSKLEKKWVIAERN